MAGRYLMALQGVQHFFGIIQRNLINALKHGLAAFFRLADDVLHGLSCPFQNALICSMA